LTSQIREPWALLSAGASASFVAACAFLALVRASRGRRVGDHPHCARCDFDLFGLPPEQERCPECGAKLDSAKARRMGRRRPRLGAMTGWSVVLVCGLAVAIGTLRAGATRFDWVRSKPVWLLRRDLASSPPANPRAQEAGRELDRRLKAGRLGDGDKRRLALMSPLAIPPNDPLFSGSQRAYLPSVCIDSAADLRRSGNLPSRCGFPRRGPALLSAT